MFFRDIEKMTLSDDDVLYRHTNDKQQLVLLKKTDTSTILGKIFGAK